MSNYQLFKFQEKFTLENGEELEELQIAYHTYGKINADRSNVVWVCHALTANSDVFDWWQGVFGENAHFNPREHFIVCANIIGSCYGTTGPLTADQYGEKLYNDFPAITIRDIVKAHEMLRKELEIEKIHLLIGASLGGQQALEWAIDQPEVFEKLVLIATNSKHSAYGIAFNESQRLAIQADVTYSQKKINGGYDGLLAARSIALLSYRSYDGYLASQKDKNDEKTGDFLASRYQLYQGWKLANRFNAYSYVTLTKAMDSHNVGRKRVSIENALARIKAQTLVIGINSDILFPISEQEFLAKYIPNSQLLTINSIYGHDGFLVEHQKIIQSLKSFKKPIEIKKNTNEQRNKYWPIWLWSGWKWSV